MQIEQQLTRVITAMDIARHQYLRWSISKRKCKRPEVEKLVMQGIQRNSVAFHRRSAGAVPFYVRGLQSDFYMSNAEIPTGYCTAILVSSDYSRPNSGSRAPGARYRCQDPQQRKYRRTEFEGSVLLTVRVQGGECRQVASEVSLRCRE